MNIPSVSRIFAIAFLVTAFLAVGIRAADAARPADRRLVRLLQVDARLLDLVSAGLADLNREGATPPDDNLAGRLRAFGAILGVVHNHLDMINRFGANPPDDNQPAVIAALTEILGEGGQIQALAADILRQLGATPPDDN